VRVVSLDIVEVPLLELAHVPCRGMDHPVHARKLLHIEAAHDEGVALPPVILINESGTLRLLDGRHRLTVARRRQLRCINAIVLDSCGDADRVVREWPRTPLSPARAAELGRLVAEADEELEQEHAAIAASAAAAAAGRDRERREREDARRERERKAIEQRDADRALAAARHAELLERLRRQREEREARKAASAARRAEALRAREEARAGKAQRRAGRAKEGISR
jgi:hypothetical protein